MLNEAIYIYIGIIVFLISVFFIYKKQKNNSQTSLLLETNGVFKHNKADGITIILSGIFLIGLFIFIGFKDPDATLNGLLVGLVLGTLFGLIGTGFLLFNFKAFFYIDNGHTTLILQILLHPLPVSFPALASTSRISPTVLRANTHTPSLRWALKFPKKSSRSLRQLRV